MHAPLLQTIWYFCWFVQWYKLEGFIKTTDFASPFVDYIANIQEMHIGIQERQENSDDNDNTENDVLDESDELDIDPDQSIDVTDNG